MARNPVHGTYIGQVYPPPHYAGPVCFALATALQT